MPKGNGFSIFLGILCVLLLLVIAVGIWYSSDPNFKTWLNTIFPSSFQTSFLKNKNITCPSDKYSTAQSSTVSSSNSVGSKLDDGITDTWYATVTSSDNDNYTEDYQSTLESSVITKKMQDQQTDWVAEVGPTSRKTMIIGDMDEATIMATPRYGITSFKFETPKTYGCVTQLVEGDDYRAKYNTTSKII